MKKGNVALWILLYLLGIPSISFSEKPPDYQNCIKEFGKLGTEGTSKPEIPQYAVDAGDLPWARFNNTPGSGFFQGEFTVGLAAQAQVIKYDFAKKRAGFNEGLGAGAAIRFYKDIRVPGKGYVPISRVKTDCRATTFRSRSDTGVPDAAPLFSITPMIFASQLTNESSLRVEPALMLGIFEDIFNVGVGFNLTGEQGDVGDVFLLLAVGAGFNF